ncbi:MAG TPA: hypothetical protein VF463_13210 [Sphingobium sp.]
MGDGGGAVRLPPTTTGLAAEPTGAAGLAGTDGSAGAMVAAVGGTAPTSSPAFGSAGTEPAAGGWLTGGCGAGGWTPGGTESAEGDGGASCAINGAQTPLINNATAIIRVFMGYPLVHFRFVFDTRNCIFVPERGRSPDRMSHYRHEALRPDATMQGKGDMRSALAPGDGVPYLFVYVPACIHA